MKNWKSLVLLVISVLLLSACGDKATTENGAKLVEEGKFIYAASGEFKPFSVTNNDGTMSGFDIEVAEAVAKEMGLEPEQKKFKFAGIVEGVKLEFKKGKVIKASATKGEDYLKKMLEIDKGAKMLGEFGIGVNYNIKKHVKNILFDEKIGGTIHIALGRAYKEGGGANESALHWDMIKDLRNGGKIMVDGKIIQENGKFLI